MEEFQNVNPLVMLFVIVAIIINLVINFTFWFLIIKIIFNLIQRIKMHKYFKSNVVNNNIKYKKDYNYNKKSKYNDVSKEKLLKFNTDNIDGLKDHIYNIFFSFEKAYNNLDYNMMKILSTKQMFQNYYTGISLDLKVGKKKIIENIERKNVVIYELESTSFKQAISAMIEISYITYTIDQNGYVISGARDKKINEKFEVIFIKYFDQKNITTCPNCGANIDGNKCNYCRTTLKNEEFKLNSIKKIIE